MTDATAGDFYNYVLIIGNDSSFIGPFKTEREATDFATMECEEVAWRVEPLTHPQAPEFWGV
jgi:hypothetical protein